MKKLYVLLFAFVGIFAMAQVTFNPGIRAGVNFARFTEGNNNFYGWNFEDSYYTPYQTSSDMKAKVDFYVGFQGNIRFAKMYALQPEINYSRQGTKVEYTQDGVSKNSDASVSYLGLHLVNKFYMNKFNVHIGPTFEFQVESKNINTDSEVDLGGLLGVGYDVTDNIGVEVRIKKGFIPVASFDDNHSNVTVQAGLYYTFKTK